MNRLRRAIVAHPGIQPLVFVGLLCLYIWTLERAASNATRIVADLLLIAIPIASNFLHRDTIREMGLRVDNLRAAGLAAAVVTVIGSLVILILSRTQGWHTVWDRGATLMVFGYLPWGFAQQYALQSFVHRRLREALPGSGWAPVAAALLFGAVHFPNPLLMASTTAAGYLWCRAFDRAPNLIPLALSHAWLVTLLWTSVPREVHRFMRIGPRYWE